MQNAESFRSTLVQIKHHARLGLMVLGLNVLFWLVLYHQTNLFSNWVGKNFPWLAEAAQATLAQKAGVLSLVIVGLLIVPLLWYALVRLLVHQMLSARFAKKIPFTKELYLNWFYRSAKAVLSMLILFVLWAMTTMVVRPDALGWTAILTGIPLMTVFFIWFQALPFEQRVFDAARRVPRLATRLGGVILFAVFLIAGVSAIFYLFGNMWAGGFDKEVILTTVQIRSYTTLFQGAFFGVMMILLTVTQIHCFRIFATKEAFTLRKKEPKNATAQKARPKKKLARKKSPKRSSKKASRRVKKKARKAKQKA